MNEERIFDLCESLISRIARCKKGTYAILTPEGKPSELIICGNRLKLHALWVKQGSNLWTIQTFANNLIMRSNRATAPGEFYLGDSNWTHKHSSLEPYPDLVCVAVATLPADSNTVIGFKGVFNDQCSTAYMIQDPALVDVLLWEGQQLEAATEVISGGYQHERSDVH